MKKGFTLVELLGVIVVLGIISLVVVPPIINQIRGIRDSVSDDTLKLIYSSVYRHMDDNRNLYPIIEDREYCITLEELFNSGRLPNPLVDPYTNEEIPETKEVLVKINSVDDIEYTFLDRGECGFIDLAGASRPELVEGMLPVKYDESINSWVKADLNSKWYSYYEQKWANVVLLTATSRGYYNNISPGEPIDEDDVLAYFVWIPRYRYRILNAEHEDLSEEEVSFEIIFEGISTDKSVGSSTNEWITHPAFSFGGDELNGFWFGKYSTAVIGATAESHGRLPMPEIDTAIIKPNSIMWRSITLSNAFVVGKEFNEPGNMYGLSEEDSETRIIRNVDWGAVAYLSRSVYGSNEQVWSNRQSAYRTGCAADQVTGGSTSTCRAFNTTNGMRASTTGNVYGVYDMAGGAHEFVMGGAYSSSANTTVRLSSSGFASSDGGASEFSPNINSSAMAPFVDKYDYNTSTTNYSHSKFGDALGETLGWDGGLHVAARGNSSSSWYIRGGRNNMTEGASIFGFQATTGAVSTAIGFRIAINPK